MVATQQCRHSPGFTLVELIVVISIIAMLIGVLLPVLNRSRATAWTVRCASLQGQLMTGWSSAMIDRDYRIPASLPWQTGPAWYEVLEKQLEPTIDLTDHHRRQRGLMCPQIDSTYPRSGPPTRYFGYAVNLWWQQASGLGESFGQRWDSIKNPSNYPWLSDPEVLLSGSLATMRLQFGQGTAPDWRVGFHHATGQSGVAVYADGHVASVTRANLVETGPDGISSWLTWD